jgi:adenylate cyclase class 2
MAFEVEIKAKIDFRTLDVIDNRDPLVRDLFGRLQSDGFYVYTDTGYIGNHHMTDTYYDTDDYSLNAAGKSLRVRYPVGVAVQEYGEFPRDIPGYMLTMKGKKLSGKTRTENEVSVLDDPAPILSILGYRPTITIEKDRMTLERRYADGEVQYTACIDSVRGLGTFIEIEAMADKDDCIQKIMAEEETILRGLGIDAPLINESYPELMAMRSKKPIHIE